MAMLVSKSVEILDMFLLLNVADPIGIIFALFPSIKQANPRYRLFCVSPTPASAPATSGNDKKQHQRDPIATRDVSIRVFDKVMVQFPFGRQPLKNSKSSNSR